MKKLIVSLIAIIAIGISVGAYYNLKRAGVAPEVTTGKITRGSVVDTVGATGTLEAVTTVQVGSQVSGTVKDLYADFNSIVHQGQVIARLDPSLLQTQIEQQKANLIRAEADVERLRVSLDDAKVKLTRAEDLSKRNLIPQSDLETAQVNARSTEAQLRSSEAQLTQARASLNQAQVNLEHTVITAPIDGIVISRNVDVGQTVAASMQAPTLYLIAADLAKMQVNASIDEADVGRIRPGQVVRFRVDAYPTEEFRGTVSQVRLQPVVVQNVVTYTTVIDVPNQQLKLKPGMTANVTIEIARADNVLRVPAAALRFRPNADMFMALNLPVPPEVQRTTAGSPGAPGGQGGRGGFGGQQMDPAMRERLQSMSPEERQAFFERMRSGGGQGDAVPAGQASGNAGPPTSLAASGAQTIDALFAPLPRRETPGRIWLWANNQLKSVRVRLGISDGTNTELISDELKPDMDVVTGILIDSGSAGVGGQTTGSGNPLIPQRGRGFRR
jgi:HlyD family secretion protein